MSVPTTYVLGLGNVLMGDDGVGPAVISAFADEYVVGPLVSVIDLGTPGLDLTPWLADAEQVIIADTVKSGARPGTICLFDKRDLLRHPLPARVSPHDPGLKETLLALEFAGRAPREVTIVGIVPGRIELGLELTAPVRDAIPQAVRAIADALERAGVPVWHRPAAAAHHPWWARATAG